MSRAPVVVVVGATQESVAVPLPAVAGLPLAEGVPVAFDPAVIGTVPLQAARKMASARQARRGRSTGRLYSCRPGAAAPRRNQCSETYVGIKANQPVLPRQCLWASSFCDIA